MNTIIEEYVKELKKKTTEENNKLENSKLEI